MNHMAWPWQKGKEATEADVDQNKINLVPMSQRHAINIKDGTDPICRTVVWTLPFRSIQQTQQQEFT